MARALRRAGPGAAGQRLHGDHRDARAAAGRRRLDPRRSAPSRRSASPSVLVAGLTLLPGAADDRRPPRLLAARQHRRLRTRTSIPSQRTGALAALRRPRAAAARAGARRDRRAVRASSRSACSPTRRTTRSAASSRSPSRASTASRCSAKSFPAGALGPDDRSSSQRERRRGHRRPTSPRCAGACDGARRRVGDRRRQRSKDGAIAQVDVTFKRRPVLRRGARRASTRCATPCSDLARAVRPRWSAPAARCRRTSTAPRERDLRVIVPVALLVITLILGDPARRRSSRRSC